jgi:hypothetical protein
MSSNYPHACCRQSVKYYTSCSHLACGMDYGTNDRSGRCRRLALIVTLDDAADVQFAAVVTVKLYIPGIGLKLSYCSGSRSCCSSRTCCQCQVPDDGRFVS